MRMIVAEADVRSGLDATRYKAAALQGLRAIRRTTESLRGCRVGLVEATELVVGTGGHLGRWCRSRGRRSSGGGRRGR